MPNYGAHLNIHPSLNHKRVMLHRLPCAHYKSGTRAGLKKTLYSFNRNSPTFEDLMAYASRAALEWHAPVKICKACRRNWTLP